MFLAFILALGATLVFSHLQPFARYTYRALVHQLEGGPLNNYLRNGMFITVGETTYMAESIDSEHRLFLKVFAYRKDAMGQLSVVTAARGHLLDGPDPTTAILALRQGNGLELPAGSSAEHKASVTSFEELQYPITVRQPEAFRPRGIDERELTLPELWRSQITPPRGISLMAIRAEFHDRILRILSILLLPALALPLSATGGRRNRSHGIAAGLILLAVYNKVLSTGESLAASGEVSGLLGQWAPFALFTTISLTLFIRSAFRAGGMQASRFSVAGAAVLSGARQWLADKVKREAS